MVFPMRPIKCPTLRSSARLHKRNMQCVYPTSSHISTQCLADLAVELLTKLLTSSCSTIPARTQQQLVNELQNRQLLHR